MPDPKTVAIIATDVAAAAEAIPVVAPYAPLIEIVLAIVRAHMNATGQVPTSDQVIAALPVSYQGVLATWAAYDAKQKGTT